jgi:hypothetical protein
MFTMWWFTVLWIYVHNICTMFFSCILKYSIILITFLFFTIFLEFNSKIIIYWTSTLSVFFFYILYKNFYHAFFSLPIKIYSYILFFLIITITITITIIIIIIVIIITRERVNLLFPATSNLTWRVDLKI